METLKTLGLAGFLFFLIKGLIWLVVFVLVGRGIIKKNPLDRWRSKRK